MSEPKCDERMERTKKGKLQEEKARKEVYLRDS